MPIQTQHADYQHSLPAWSLMRDVLKGPDWVKQRGERYLPRPSGMKVGMNGVDPYVSYLRRARFPDIVAPALRGLLGCLQRKDHQFILPDRMTYLLDSATADGIRLSDLVSRIAAEVLTTGRCPLLVDSPQDGGLPYLVPFQAEQLTNWRCGTNNGKEYLEMAVIRSVEMEASPDDVYSEIAITIYRGLLLENDQYRQQIYVEMDGDKTPNLDMELWPSDSTSTLTVIPLVIIGSTDIDPDPDIIPLFGLAEIALSIYQQYADYRQALFMTSQPTAVISGIGAESAPSFIGASTVWTLEPPDARAYFLEFSGAGIGAQLAAIQNEFQEAAIATTNLMQSKRAAETAEALRLRQGAISATLLSLADTLETGLTTALGYVADWIGADKNEISVRINKDFVDSGFDPNSLNALVAGWQARAYSREVLWSNLRNADIIPAELTDEELQGQIETESPALSS